MNKNVNEGVAKSAVFVLLCLFGTVAMAPLVWLVASTLKTPADKFTYLMFSPISHWTLNNYRHLFNPKLTQFGHYMLNSFFVTNTLVVIQLFFSSLAGFALAKYQFKGKNIIMGIMLATMMLPGQVTMAPLYTELYHFHMIDNFYGLIIPGMVSVFGIFLFRQSILQIPDELLQAARIDGCSEFRIYWDIVMPITRPMIGAFCLMTFMGAWNNFLWPQIILHHDYYYTLPMGLNQLTGIYATNQAYYGMSMAGTLLSVAPVMVLFLFLQKEFVAGLTAGAVKG
jgi:multiple sugar transport system permease protein